MQFDHPEQAEVAKRVLENEGYNADLHRQVDDAVMLVAVPAAVVPAESVLVARMQLLASELGREYMGHGGVEQYPLG